MTIKTVKNNLKFWIDISIESNKKEIKNLQNWIITIEKNPRKAIRSLKRKTILKYKSFEKEIIEELISFENTGVSGEKLKKFQEEKILSAQKSIITTKKRLRRDRKRLKMIDTNLSTLLIEMGKLRIKNQIEQELIIYERKFKLKKLSK